MQKDYPLAVGDVVQLGPNTGNPMFSYCFLVVTELKSWGCQGYVQGLGEGGVPGGQAYYRPNFEDMEYVGRAPWVSA